MACRFRFVVNARWVSLGCPTVGYIAVETIGVTAGPRATIGQPDSLPCQFRGIKVSIVTKGRILIRLLPAD